jgi:CubicO group peptidase (beta-lactamase class C family)
MTSTILSHSDVASTIDLLAAWIEAQMAYQGVPGLSIGIVYDQELIWARGFGYANAAQKIAATPQTIYRIASITKLFTSTAILQLRDAGQLQLDDPIARHLAWFNIQNRYPDAPPLTIRHLLTHTAGLPREAAFPYWTDSNFPTREQIIETLPQQKTILPAEMEWKYSNLGLALAGEIVATVADQPYANYVQQHILEPLGMHSTYVAIDPDQPQLAVGYGRRLPDGTRGLSPFSHCQGITPAANMATTVEDLARFARLQFRAGPAGGAQILRGSTLREMQRVHWLEPEWQAGWGLGFRIVRQNNKTYIGHGGAVLGYRTQLRLCPADKIAVIVLTNADDGNPLQYVEKAFQWVAPAIIKVVQPGPETAGPDPAWRQYVGKYRSAWADMQVLVLNGNLVAIDPSLPDPLAELNKLIPVKAHTFRLESKNGFGANGELLLFEVDEAGTVQRVKSGENYTYPVRAW